MTVTHFMSNYHPRWVADRITDALSDTPVLVPQQERREIGSSPRTWGTRALQTLQVGRSRFIPTHVGNARASRLTHVDRG